MLSVPRMNGFMCSRGWVRILSLAIAATVFGAAASAQTCISAGTLTPRVAVNGLAEQVGDILLTCTGGVAGSPIFGSLYITLNTNITNPLDDGGLPKNIAVTATGSAFASNAPVLSSPSSLVISNISYTVPTPNSVPVVITISGIRSAVAALPPTQSGEIVNASLVGVGFTVSPAVVPVALGIPTLLGAVQNNGINCNGSPLPPLPSTTDFPGFTSGSTTSSAVRVTEAFPTAFVPANPG